APKVELHWTNLVDKTWQPAAGESLCNTKAKGDFQLTATIDLGGDIQVVKRYLIQPHIGICYLKPVDLTLSEAQAYSGDFDEDKGFSAGAKTKFPTTGFAQAKFDIVLNQPFPDEYRLRSSHQDKGVNVSGYFAEPTVT